MEFRHFKTFQTIVQTGSFLSAAEQLGYAQSTITLHIKQLEAELGVKVFHRQAKKIHLTTAGRALASHADILLHRSALLHQEMLELVAGNRGHLRIGSIEPVASLRLPELLVNFCQQYPKVKLTLETGVTEVISQRVAAGQLDLAICSAPAAKLALDFQILFRDSMTLLIPSSHKLSQITTVKLEDLAEERLLLTEVNCPYRQVFEREISVRGINPNLGLEIMSLSTLKSMVQSGLGIGIVPTASINSVTENAVVKQIDGLPLELPVGIATLPEKTIPGLALDLLIEMIITSLKVD